MPVRLSDGRADARIDVANRIFADVAALVERAGGTPILIDTVDLAGIDAVVLPGGGDVDPARYGGEVIDALYDVNPAQDALDFGIAHAALAAGLPVLGVCRGLQVLNVVYGGTLAEDLPPTDVVHTVSGDGAQIVWAWHPVAVSPGSLLSSHTDAELQVASGHHQGIARLGDGLTASAVAADGLVEAFERAEDRVIAVQWHPEAEGTPAAHALAPFSALMQLVAQRWH